MMHSNIEMWLRALQVYGFLSSLSYVPEISEIEDGGQDLANISAFLTKWAYF